MLRSWLALDLAAPRPLWQSGWRENSFSIDFLTCSRMMTPDMDHSSPNAIWRWSRPLLELAGVGLAILVDTDVRRRRAKIWVAVASRRPICESLQGGANVVEETISRIASAVAVPKGLLDQLSTRIVHLSTLQTSSALLGSKHMAEDSSWRDQTKHSKCRFSKLKTVETWFPMEKEGKEFDAVLVTSRAVIPRVELPCQFLTRQCPLNLQMLSVPKPGGHKLQKSHIRAAHSGRADLDEQQRSRVCSSEFLSDRRAS
ncbi:hypothetical protein IWZ03DRAFT_403563 [Phyllosticta citriasiana]|uniref:Uncharacterized protein n=1 Tax=Phyllosticta citriasiana TaxID=595635 RepID=A0ABR1L0L1_9PEZI